MGYGIVTEKKANALRKSARTAGGVNMEMLIEVIDFVDVLDDVTIHNRVRRRWKIQPGSGLGSLLFFVS